MTGSAGTVSDGIAEDSGEGSKPGTLQPDTNQVRSTMF